MKEREEAAEAAARKTEADKRDAQQKERLDQLFKLGLRADFGDNHYKGYGGFVAFLDVQVSSPEEWEKVIAEITPVIERGKKKEAEDAAEAERIAKEKREQEEERIRKDAAEKAIAEDKSRREEADRQEAERVAQASDKEKFDVLVTYLNDLPAPGMKSAKHKKLLLEVHELRNKLVSHIKAKA